MRDDRQVKFNLNIAHYKPGQIVNYTDMPPGHQFWVDHEDILGSDRICEFVVDEVDDEKEKAEAKAKVEAEAKLKADENAKIEAAAKVEAKRVADEKKDREEAEAKAKLEAEAKLETDVTANTKADEFLNDINKSQENEQADPETEKDNDLNFNFNAVSTDPKICPGVNARDDSPCESTKLKKNGYCWRHRFQAPAKSE